MNHEDRKTTKVSNRFFVVIVVFVVNDLGYTMSSGRTHSSYCDSLT
jgi:hypothetical protein